jgi:hypothetical protein
MAVRREGKLSKRLGGNVGDCDLMLGADPLLDCESVSARP